MRSSCAISVRKRADLLAGYINAALLYAHLAALKAAQQFAQAGQCVGTLV